MLNLTYMFGFFKKKRRDMDQLIFDIAEHNRSSDCEELWRRLRGCELYAQTASSSPFPVGARIQVTSADQLRLPLVTLPNGLRIVMFFLHKSDPRLGSSFIGMTTLEAFTMAIRAPDSQGIGIQNGQESWVALPTDAIVTVVDRFLREE